MYINLNGLAISGRTFLRLLYAKRIHVHIAVRLESWKVLCYESGSVLPESGSDLSEKTGFGSDLKEKKRIQTRPSKNNQDPVASKIL